MPGMPKGTIGLRARGRVDAEYYTQTLEPAVRGEPINLLYVLDDDPDHAAGAANFVSFGESDIDDAKSWLAS